MARAMCWAAAAAAAALVNQRQEQARAEQQREQVIRASRREGSTHAPDPLKRIPQILTAENVYYATSESHSTHKAGLSSAAIDAL
jgi:hypothetical protein